MFVKLKNIHSTAWAMLSVMVIYLLFGLLSLPEPVLWISHILILFFLYRNLGKINYKRIVDKPGFLFLFIFFIWLIIGFLRASIVAEGYWIWKMVFQEFILSLFYVVVLLGANITIIRDYFKLYWLLFIPMLLVSFFAFGNPHSLSYMPFMSIMLFFVFIPGKRRLMLLAIILLYLATFDHRNDMIKIIIAVAIGFMIAYFYNVFTDRLIRILQIIFLLLPFLLFYFGASGIFNVFKMDEYLKGDHSFVVQSGDEVEVRDFKVDTRTFIYQNVFYTLSKYNAFLFGRSPAFGDEGFGDGVVDEQTGLKGRYGNEVGVLDILLYYGVVGVTFYFSLFVRASYLAIYRSRNRIAKGVGLYTAFLWFMSFIWEKPMFETFFMMDIVLIGLCLSKPFRQMSDKQMRLWVRSIFLNPRKFIDEPVEHTLDIKRSVSRSV